MASRRLLNGDDDDDVDRRPERGRTKEKEEGCMTAVSEGRELPARGVIRVSDRAAPISI